MTPPPAMGEHETLAFPEPAPRGTLRIGESVVRERAAKDEREGVVVDGRYRILRQIGTGGMGLVYEARRIGFDTRVALKILRTDISHRGNAQRLEREARAASAIGNPHIVDVRDFGRIGGATYVAMELIEGEDLLTVIRSGKLSLDRARCIALQVCEALAAAHEKGIVHRDLKPENILLTSRGDEPEFVKLLDFGIARMQGTSRLTAAGTVVGTPEYMSPEQCTGLEVDRRADIYALGVMLYEMVTGVLPFCTPDLAELIWMQLHRAPVPPSVVRQDGELDADFDALVLRCLAKDPDERFAAVSEVADALRALRTKPEPVTEAIEVGPRHVPLEAPPRSSGLRTGVTALLAVMIGVGALVAFSSASNAEPPKAPVSKRPAVAEPSPEPTRIAEPLPATAPRLWIESDPAGAEVLRGGETLGTTPLSLPRPSGAERVVLELRARGRRPQAIVLSEVSVGPVRVALVPRTAPPAPEATEAVAPAEPIERRQPIAPVDTVEEPPAHGAHTQFLDPWR